MWIESYQELADHPKTHRLMAQLGIGLAQAVGHLHLLWWWALTYAPDGDLSAYDAEDIARAARWDGDPEAFLEALIHCGPGGRPGFIERDERGMRLHDWTDYGNERTHREKAAARKRRQRERERAAQAEAAGATHEPAEPADTAASDGGAAPSAAEEGGVSRDSHVTVTRPSRDSHGTSRDARAIPPASPAPSLGLPPQSPSPPFSPPPECESSSRDPAPPFADASVATRSPRAPARTRARGELRDIALAVLHESGLTIPLPDTPAGRCAAAYFARNPVSKYWGSRERNRRVSSTLAAFDEALQKGVTEEALLDEIRASPVGEQPWDIAKRAVALARDPPRLGFRPYPLPDEGGSET